MSSLHIAIPFERIERIKPVLARQGEGISDVYAREGCDYIVNFGTYVFASRALDSGLKLDGKLLKTGYSCEGFAVAGNRLTWSWEGQGYDDWIGQWSSYKKTGKLYAASRSDKNAQIGVGITNTSLVLAGVSKASALTSYEFMTRYFADCPYAIKGDGSYSAQWITPQGSNITTRNVVWYLCVWIKKDQEEDNVREYINNSPNRKPVYETTACKKQIGSLDPYERCTQLYEDAGFAVVLYYITGSSERKVGFVKK